ncbi:hypothetical protein [Microbaculum marinisediminis]|uniref:Outer membrane protein beta-barrel domain-containing protein n=1 Tax=Microbaculum marinisediminis TaxID=2931392 RepID=A0AAW5R0S3_9HYPH|nr:hypothetical protein [Microbaculum sp. A6E488]MCT8973875.1 hypothetical protein [Microbaculum sp. A6E488]
MRLDHCARVAVLTAGLAIVGTGQGQAADIATVPETVVVEEIAPSWTFAVAPYFWMAGLSGDVATFGAPPVNVDVNFSDILDALDFGGMAVAEARYGRFSFSSDVLYLKASTDKATPFGVIASSVGLGNETFELSALAGYALIDTPNGHLDIVGGARVWSVDMSLSFSGGILNGRRVSDSATWVDALVGLRGRVGLTERLHLTGWALAGAGAADSDWDLFGGVGYAFNDRFSAVLGYRAAGVDYSDGPFLFDVVMQGPVAGVVLRF